MLAHVKTIGWLALLRAVCGGGFGVFCFVALQGHRAKDLEPADVLIVTVLASLLLGVAVIRVVQGVACLRGRRLGRRLGVGLGFFDVCNLVCFPVSTGLGLYALVTYRKPEVVEFFSRRDP